MFEKTRLLNLLVCAVFGLVGGVVSHLILTAEAVSAQQKSIVRAERFELIDEKGKVHAILGRGVSHPENTSAELIIMDGRSQVELDTDSLRISDDGRTRVALGLHSVPVDGGPALALEYQLVIYNDKGEVKHRLRSR